MKNFIECSIILFVLFFNVACIYRTDIVEQMKTTRLAMVKQIEKTQAGAIEGANKFRQDAAAKSSVSDNIEDIQRAAAEYDSIKWPNGTKNMGKYEKSWLLCFKIRKKHCSADRQVKRSSFSRACQFKQ